ncbi:MAG: hypothetical protein QG597_2273 [Actinomycetota bacterium]|nr:hypothetical protein [Actinomycetota bacterium]
MTSTPTGWIVAGHHYDDREVPEPFRQLQPSTNNVGASMWIHLTSGARIAALPTGPWHGGYYAFYYTAPHSDTPVLLKEWTASQRRWDGDETQYFTCFEEACDYFNSAVGKAI